MIQPKPQIICIGFHKTGTTSLSDAMAMLGFPIAHASVIFRDVSGDVYDHELMGHIEQNKPFRAKLYEAICKGIDVSHGIQDSPTVFFYKELSLQYPDAKFIFTTRDVGAWIASLKGFVRNRSNPLRQYMYGVSRLSGNEKVFIDTYHRYHQDIRAHFAGHSNFREFDIGKGDLNWENLMDFLGDEFVPDIENIGALSEPFPRSNMSSKTLNALSRS